MSRLVSRRQASKQARGKERGRERGGTITQEQQVAPLDVHSHTGLLAFMPSFSLLHKRTVNWFTMEMTVKHERPAAENDGRRRRGGGEVR